MFFVFSKGSPKKLAINILCLDPAEIEVQINLLYNELLIILNPLIFKDFHNLLM